MEWMHSKDIGSPIKLKKIMDFENSDEEKIFREKLESKNKEVFANYLKETLSVKIVQT